MFAKITLAKAMIAKAMIAKATIAKNTIAKNRLAFSKAAYGVPGRIRTADLPLRRRSLYPTELRKHYFQPP